eukprot:8341655-Karenia_brevis.AAC.1
MNDDNDDNHDDHKMILRTVMLYINNRSLKMCCWHSALRTYLQVAPPHVPPAPSPKDLAPPLPHP